MNKELQQDSPGLIRARATIAQAIVDGEMHVNYLNPADHPSMGSDEARRRAQETIQAAKNLPVGA